MNAHLSALLVASTLLASATSQMERRLQLGEGKLFGAATALEADTLMVAAPSGLDLFRGGAVYVFAYRQQCWALSQKLVANQISPQSFGFAIALDGDTLVISDPMRAVGGNSSAGMVYAYERSAGRWSRVSSFAAPTPQTSGRFGSALAIHGDRLLIGAEGASTAFGQQSGAAYIYERDAGVWTFREMLLGDELGPFHGFGSAVGLVGNQLAVGARAYGTAYLFRRDQGTWQQELRLLPPGVHTDLGNFGARLVLGVDRVAISAPKLEVPQLGRVGSVFLYDRRAGAWELVASLIPDDPPGQREFGSGLAMSQGRVLVGSDLHGQGNSDGLVTVYDQAEGVWLERGQLRPGGDGEYRRFGRGIASDGNRFVIGAPDSNNQRGALYSYEILRSIGSGCANAQGIPSLDPGDGMPLIGGQLVLTVSEVPNAAQTIGILGFSETSWNGRALPIDLSLLGIPGCQLHISADRQCPTSPLGNSAQWCLVIPDQPELIGLQFYLQALVLDLSGSEIQVSLSDAVVSRIGGD